MDWDQIGKWSLAALGAIAAAGIAIKLIINRNANNHRTVVKGNRVGGDIVVGNKTSNSRSNKR
jgi:hypothetical protein